MGINIKRNGMWLNRMTKGPKIHSKETKTKQIRSQNNAAVADWLKVGLTDKSTNWRYQDLFRIVLKHNLYIILYKYKSKTILLFSQD